MRFSQARGHKVVDNSTAQTSGKVTDAVIDTPNARVVALRLKKSRGLKKASGDADTLPWSQIASFGGDAVTIARPDAVRQADPAIRSLEQRRYSLSGKRVLTTQGVELGHVTDFDFDPTDGTVRALLLKNGAEIPGPDLVATGTYAVVVRPPR